MKLHYFFSYLLIVILNSAWASKHPLASDSDIKNLSLKSVTIDFKDFAAGEYKKILDAWTAGKKFDEAVESIEETEVEIKSRQKVRAKLHEYIENLKFKNFLWSQYRWYLAESLDDPQLAIDLASHHVITHGFEMIGGAIVTGRSLGWNIPGWASGLIGTVALVITVPGLDPVCILGFVALRKLPPYRLAYRAARVTLMLVPNYIYSKLGVKGSLAWLKSREDRLEFVRKQLMANQPGQQTILEIPSDELNELQFAIKPEKSVSMEINKNGFVNTVKIEALGKMGFTYHERYKGLELNRVEINKQQLSEITSEELKKIKVELKRCFGGNTANAVFDALKNLKKQQELTSSQFFGPLEQIKSRYHIMSVSETERVWNLELRKQTVQSKGILDIWKRTRTNCNLLWEKVKRVKDLKLK